MSWLVITSQQETQLEPWEAGLKDHVLTKQKLGLNDMQA